MPVRTPASAFLHQPLAGQQITGGADGRPIDVRMPRREPVQELVAEAVNDIETPRVK
jgi:hypothetical protein